MTAIKNLNTRRLGLDSSPQGKSLKNLQAGQLNANQLDWTNQLYHRVKVLFKNFQSLVNTLLLKKNKFEIKQTFTKNNLLDKLNSTNKLNSNNDLGKKSNSLQKLNPNESSNNLDNNNFFSFLELENTSSNKEIVLGLQEDEKIRALEKERDLLEFERLKKIRTLKKDDFYRFFKLAEQEPSRKNLSELHNSYDEKELAKAVIEAFRPYLHKSLSTASHLMKRTLNKRIGSYRRTRFTQTSRVIKPRSIRRRR